MVTKVQRQDSSKTEQAFEITMTPVLYHHTIQIAVAIIIANTVNLEITLSKKFLPIALCDEN